MTSEERKEKRFQKRQAIRQNKREVLTGLYSFDRITDPENLVKAFAKSKKGVFWKKSVQSYEMNRLKNISSAVDALRNKKSIHKGFVEFDINERGKRRHIRSVTIDERVIQKCLCDEVLVPLLSRSLIYDNGATIKNKGFHFTIRRLKHHLSEYYRSQNFKNEGYVLTIDFSKFFDSIVHHVLYREQNRYICDVRVQFLLRQCISVFGDDTSLGLGSQVSQISSLFYPNKIDHFIKDRCQIKYYARYMDDMYIIHHDKLYLKTLLFEINEPGYLHHTGEAIFL
jgi:hypothetical protein